ncbi:MAG: hypothetical protein ABI851_16180 [Saprospiraceae bacterium]
MSELIKELKTIGLSQKRLAQELGISIATFQRRINSGSFSDSEIIETGNILSKYKGDPLRVWPKFASYQDKVLFRNTTDESREVFKSVSLYENSVSVQ